MDRSRSLVPVAPELPAPADLIPRPQMRGAPPEDEIDIRRALRTLWRRKFLLLGTIFLITGSTGVLVFKVTPTYTAETLIVVGQQKTNLINIERLLPDARLDLLQVQTEVATLKAESLAADVAQKLALFRDPEFIAPGFFERALDRVAGYLPGLGSNPSAAAPVEAGALVDNRAVKAVRARTTIKPGLQSYMISLKFDSKSPRKAALVANTFAETYIQRQLDTKLAAARAANDFLKKRLDTLRERMLVGQAAVEEYRVRSGVVRTANLAGNPSTLTTQQVAQINGQLVDARLERDSVAARLQTIEERLANRLGASSAVEVLQSPLIQTLRGQEALLLRTEADLSTTFGDRHPRMIEVRAQVRDLQMRIEIETARIVEGVRNEVRIARVRVASLESSLHDLTGRVASENITQIRLGELEREAQADRDIYLAFLTRFKETTEQIDFQQADARIISAAAVPLFPSAPKKGRTLALALVASTLFGFLVVLIAEKLKRGIHTPEEVERWGTQVIGIVPNLNEGWRGWIRRGPRRQSSPKSALSDPYSTFAEAMQRLRTVMHLGDPNKRPRIILFASALGGEGKSTVSRAFAEVAARSGQKTIHINCDLRRPDPTPASRFAGHAPSGLADILKGEFIPDSAIVTDPDTGCHFLGPGLVDVGSPLDLLRSGAMRALIVRLSLEYELIVLDSPPVLPVSDALVLSRLADVTVYLVRWGHTSADAAFGGLKELHASARNIAGVMLTRANMRKLKAFGQVGHGSYYGLYAPPQPAGGHQDGLGRFLRRT